MKTFKKILCTLLVVAMCLTAAPLQGVVDMEWPAFSEWFGGKVSAVDEYTEGYYTYTVGDGEATITDVNEEISGDVIIPTILGGYNVTSIGNYAFYRCRDLSSVTIGSDITTIATNAFISCFNLKNIIVEADNMSYSSDNNGILFDRTKTVLIRCPENNNNSIYIIPNSVKIIGEEAFYNCDNLKGIIIGDSVTTIGKYAFYDCDILKDITLGDSVTDIGYRAFYETDYYNQSSNWINNILYIGNYLIEAKPLISGSHTVKNGTKVIANSAFNGCTNLTSMIIPNSTTIIGNNAFEDCSGLISITIGNGVTTIGAAAFRYCTKLEHINLPNSVNILGRLAFSNSGIKTILIGSGIKIIDEYCFSFCENLTSVTIPSNVLTIGDSAFSYCDNITSVTISNGVSTIGKQAFYLNANLVSIKIAESVKTIGDLAFLGCNNLKNIYFEGAKNTWDSIHIGNFNYALFSANIHYGATGQNNTDNPNTPDGPNESDKPKEEPRDFSDYEVVNGKLEEVIYGVDRDGNEYIKEVVVNGKKYKVEEDTDINGLLQGQVDQKVAFAVLDDEIVMLMPIEYLLEDDITSHIQDDIGLYCSYGEMYSEEDYNRGFKWSEPDKNNIVYPIYEEFNPNKELQLSTYLIQKDFFVAASHPKFDSELMEYITTQMPEAQIHIDKIQIKLRNTNAISFNGKDTYTINVNADIKSNQTINNSIPITVKSEYEIPEDKSVELVLFDIVITGKKNGEKVEFTNTENIKIKNCDYVEPVKDKNNKPTNKQYAKDAAAKLDNLTGAITLTGLWELFSSEELDYIGNVILAEIAMAEAPKDTLKQYLSTKVIDSLFNIDSNFIKVGEDTIEFAVAGDTKYGKIKLKLICKYSKVYFSGSEFCFTGSVDYEVVGGEGASKLPSSYKNGGPAGMFSSVDMQSFCESAYKLFECHLQKGVDDVWGNDVDGAADLIFGTIVNEILAETELESVSNITFKIMAKPGKSVLINCPVDVYVYNADNELVAAVVGNEVIKTDEKAKIAVDGDVKKVILLDESYNIVYKAVADGEMKVTVEEYGTSGGLLNSSTISKIPLIAGRKYTQSIDDSFMENSDYMIVSASGNEYAPDKEYSTLAGHDYVSGIIKEVTCQENGCVIHTCSKCGYVFAETIQSNGHNFTEGESKCSNCDFDRAKNCGCKCHKTGFFAKIIWKITIFFNKIFKKNKECTCGIYHY